MADECEQQPPVKSKRGRKSKKTLELEMQLKLKNDAEMIENGANITSVEVVHTAKRGRKPKGGKLIRHQLVPDVEKIASHNVILHLKCYKRDIEHSNGLGMGQNNTAIYPFNEHVNGYTTVASSSLINSNSNIHSSSGLDANPNSITQISQLISTTTQIQAGSNTTDITNINTINERGVEIHAKLKQMEKRLHINNTFDKKSACFWCTYDFDTPPIYIPKECTQIDYKVYGCFCTPECAAGFLFDEGLDISTKFERYHQLNHLYGKVFNYTKNIKPAPNPRYILEKFYGNLTIQEYREISDFGKLVLVLDKPLTPILPEIHECNDDMLLHQKIIPSNNNIISMPNAFSSKK
jgi:hypothetical protein